MGCHAQAASSMRSMDMSMEEDFDEEGEIGAEAEGSDEGKSEEGGGLLSPPPSSTVASSSPSSSSSSS
eukprot:CAMPEP_0201535058 /NCGR_PEP_ID=MMETSP0161_2-20130828/57931_1 /ASSEMBLY_ACC=CAM_ASM_000251 /TAXON_ID=180227 /ORGANISM="Neoparamoeba aestuarina, Strain SoJaBio B1-5/56/2" /LENGTH=67 /DNA_ID=CAMNT_0047940019 /DNA_START=1 /DNA_END=201 /DNA_ORIENTATION=-